MANEALRKRQTEELVQQGLIPWLYWLTKALTKLPAWKGTVYRGVRVALTSLSKNYVRGRNVTWVGFTSTTTDKDETMRRFAGGGAGGGSEEQRLCRQRWRMPAT